MQSIQLHWHHAIINLVLNDPLNEKSRGYKYTSFFGEIRALKDGNAIVMYDHTNSTKPLLPYCG